jgi:hypothetical protein
MPLRGNPPAISGCAVAPLVLEKMLMFEPATSCMQRAPHPRRRLSMPFGLAIVRHFTGRLFATVLILVAAWVAPVNAQQTYDLPPTEAWFTEDDAQEAFSKQVARLFWAGRFDVLDAYAESYLQSQSRWRSGNSRLRHLFDSIAARGYWNTAANENLSAAVDMTRGWIATRPNSHIAHLHHAYYLFNRAMNIRGGKPFHEMTFDQVTKYTVLTAEAYGHLQHSKKMASHDPHWHMLMIEFATVLGENRSTIMGHFSRAVEQFPNYEGIYYKMLSATSPQWGGSKQELHQVADILKKKTMHAFGQSIAARFYLIAADYMEASDFEAAFSVAEVKMALEDLLIRYPSFYFINNVARFACKVDDIELARKMFDVIIELKGAGNEGGWSSEDHRALCLLMAMSAPFKIIDAPAVTQPAGTSP